MKKRLALITFIIILFLITLLTSVFAGEIRIDFTCYTKEVQKSFAYYGRKLDLNGIDRTPDSWGFLENKGTHFLIYTYKPVTQEDFEIIKWIVMGG